MEWEVEFTDEFNAWWETLTLDEQKSVNVSGNLLAQHGPHLPFPHSSGIAGSQYGEMRELRTQHQGRPYRTLYAFDHRRMAILLIGGDKTGDDRWYHTYVPLADRIYAEHLLQLKREKR